MKSLLLLLCVSFAALSFSVLSHAQDAQIPSHYEVSGIAVDDVLNVRSGPSIKYRVLGNLKLGAGTIEVLSLSEDQQWGRVLWGESNGWVFTRYLRAISPTSVTNTNLPVGLQCSGTEPFWDFVIESKDNVTFKILFSDSMESATIQSVAESSNRLYFPVALVAASDTVNLTAMVNTRQCTDGMTDREYGWEIELLVTEGNKPTLFSGCCSL